MAARPRAFVSHLLRRRYWAPAAALTLAVWGAVALSMLPLRDAGGEGYGANPYGLVTPLENRALDLLFQLRDARRQQLRGRGLSEPITIVEIDEPSIRASNVRLQKWPRDWYARLIDRAREGGARVVGLDLYLSEKGGDYAEEEEPDPDAPVDKDYAADKALADAIYNTENIVLVEKLEAGGIPSIVPLPLFAEGATAVGFADLPHDSDNAVRSTLLVHAKEGEAPKFSFGAALAQLYTGEALAPAGANTLGLGPRLLPLRNDRTMQLDFRGRTPSFRRVSAGRVLFPQSMPAEPGAAAQVSDELFRDRIVLIGATNNDAPDLFYTPFYEPLAAARLFDRGLPDIPARMPGVEIHATAVATMLFGQSLTRPSYSLQVGFLLLVLGLAALPVLYMRPLVGFAAVALLAFAALAASAWAFDARGLVLPLASSWLSLAAFAPLGFALRYGRERAVREEKEAERAQIMDIFSRCVSQEVADELWQKRDRVELGGESRVVTIIFTDIRGFTTLTESAASSKEVVSWLNDYFSRMHRIVCFYGGHINKYIGDGLMIVFGAPVDRGTKLEARAAVLCGLKMLEEVEHINEEWEGTGRPKIAIGVGIHTGEAVCGVVGAPGRSEYTIIGDTVNLAARLEGTTKETPVSLLVSSATAELLGEGYEVEPLGDVKVKGKTESTSVFSVRPREAQKEGPAHAAVGG
ncbi:MAG TPA: adenylate/guanylate cyclase domain-containing protein [Pyrinomonadaceae bacterium]|jgi:adenylate cyclase|nr:adenylate/guanylate cyclase domain-containing protein [Pyrinomonadaceae bacterium]